MSRQRIYAGALGMVITLACSPRVEIGHGHGGAGGEGTPVSEGGASGAEAPGSAGEPVEGGAGPAIPTGGKAGSGQVIPIPVDDGPQAEVGKVDLLLAVDNSYSMAEKQQLFAQTIPELVARMINPRCIGDTGDIVSQPATPSASCPANSRRETEPLRDLHVGVITSSLGSHGSVGAKDVCVGAAQNDHAHLLPSVRPGLSSYNDEGYLKWDPDQHASPEGEADAAVFTASLRSMLEAVGENGCGYEAQLESVYRFLVDPEPPVSIEVQMRTATTAPVGIDQDLLTQRDNFLRPDSSVVVVMLTDENDCSIIDESYGWLISRAAPMYRATSACSTNPNDACCQLCGETTANDGCPPIADDPECQKSVTLTGAGEDDLNLRCWDQKRRFGFDFLYPVERYVGGFADAQVRGRGGELVANPLFHRGGVDRDRSLFTLAVLGGVPWQDLATTSSLNGDELELMTNAQLNAAGRWPMIVGNLKTFTPPSDPFMREATAPRSGQNPLSGDDIVSADSTDPAANAINGHEQHDTGGDLQYACTFELPEPIVCDQTRLEEDRGCSCFEEDLVRNRPVCQPPTGGAPETTQYYAKAYPSLRELDVARQLGRRSVLASVCARNTQDEERSDYGYRPMFGAIANRVADTLRKP